MIRFPAALLLLLTVRGALAQEETKCCCSTVETLDCLSGIYKKLDAELNETYRKAMKSAGAFTAQDVRNLRDAERLWIGYRDAACKAEIGLAGGGSIGPTAGTICMIRLTRQRVAELKMVYFRDINARGAASAAKQLKKQLNGMLTLIL